MHTSQQHTHFSQNMSDNKGELLPLIGWEAEERARGLIESGYANFNPDSRHPFIGNGERSGLFANIWGKDIETYQANVRYEFPNLALAPRAFAKPLRGDNNREHSYLSGKDFQELYSAVAYANSRGIVLNTHISITWGLLGIHDHTEAAQVLRHKFLKHLQEWFEYRNANGPDFVWLYVHEVGRKHGFHTHLLVSIPSHMRQEFKQWVHRRLNKICRTGNTPKNACKVVAPPSDPVGRQWRYFQYLCKGISSKAVTASAVGPRPYVHAERLIGWRGEHPGKVLCRKRCGVSNNLGARSRQQHRFQSLLERGVADVRRLYAGMELLDHHRTQPVVSSAPVLARLLEREKVIRQIQEEDAQNERVHAAARRVEARRTRQEQQSLLRFELQQKEQVERLNALFRL